MLLLPLATRSHLAAPEADGALARRSLERVLLATLPGALGLMLLAPALVGALFGDAFAPSASLLRLLAPLLVLAGLAETLGALLLARGRVSDRTRHQAEAALLNLSANALLLPVLGVTAAAGAAVATQLLLVVRHLGVLAPALARTSGDGPQSARILAPALACIAGSLALVLLPAPGRAVSLAALLAPVALAAALLRDALARETGALAAAWRSPRRAATPH
jgi:O-antigen/teichoic acid export membrane protein